MLISNYIYEYVHKYVVTVHLPPYLFAINAFIIIYFAIDDKCYYYYVYTLITLHNIYVYVCMYVCIYLL